MTAVVYKLHLKCIRRVLLNNRPHLAAYKAALRQVFGQGDHIIKLKATVHDTIVPLAFTKPFVLC